jgi:hypothetical protein
MAVWPIPYILQPWTDEMLFCNNAHGAIVISWAQRLRVRVQPYSGDDMFPNAVEDASSACQITVPATGSASLATHVVRRLAKRSLYIVKRPQKGLSQPQVRQYG